MARRRRERMSEGKKNIIAGLIQEYDIKSAEDCAIPGKMDTKKLQKTK